MEKPVRGTREWAVAAIDCCVGCSNGCKYCYGRYEQVVKKREYTPKQWDTCQVISDLVGKDQPKFPGQVMFPTNHDIFPDNLDSCIKVIGKLLEAGNQVLIVSKPRLDCVEKMCAEFKPFISKILFRFTITARNLEILSYWEPDAPTYKERLVCLEYAHDQGFQTSVSVEPMLDVDDIVGMVHELIEYTTQTVWVGKMNKIDQRVKVETEKDLAEVNKIKTGQVDEKILKVYNVLKKYEKIRWKESIKEVVGLKSAKEAGLDI